jgi:hypothetical protein
MRKKRKSAACRERSTASRASAIHRLAPHADLVVAIRVLVADLSDKEWEKLPPNLASRVDELLYDVDK